MEQNLDLTVIKATQESLGKYVKKPPLTEKLLRKPPFRFLHDIITCVLKTTGFFDGLFDEAELISDNVKDKDSKIVFLNKVISVISLATGEPIRAKPAKIVAGQEPERTNELLQCIAAALDKKLTSSAAVKQYKSGVNGLQVTKSKEQKDKPDVKLTKKVIEDKREKLTSRSTDKLSSNKKDSLEKSTKNIDRKTNSKANKQDGTIIKKDSPPKKTSVNDKSTNKQVIEKKLKKNEKNIRNDNLVSETTILISNGTLEDHKNDYLISQEIETDPNHVCNPDKFNEDNSNSHQNDIPDIQGIHSNKCDNVNPDVITDIDHPTGNEDYSNSNVVDSSNNVNGNIDQTLTNNSPINRVDKIPKPVLHQDGIRQASFESKELPKQRSLDESTSRTTGDEKDNLYNRPASVRPPSSRPGAPRPREKHETVLATTDNILVGKVNIIVENKNDEEEEETSIIVVESNPEEEDQVILNTNANQHGHLVQQILDSQKEFSKSTLKKTEIEWQMGINKAKEAFIQEIEQVKVNIQALSRVANPMGKLIDHIQEDVEVMRQELQQWTNAYEEASKELIKQKNANAESLLPLKMKIKQIDADISEKKERIIDIKVVIQKNSMRIDKLLTNANVK